MSQDLRGFDYVAEPLLQRRQWELDAAVADAGRATERVAQARAQAAALSRQLAAQAARSGGVAGSSLDPSAHARTLAWLARLHARVADAAQDVARLEAQREEVMARLRECQARVEAVRAHREDAVRDYAAAASFRHAAEADRDWLARGTAAREQG